MDFYSDDESDPDLDAGLQEDLEALRRSCILSGADPDATLAHLSSSSSYLAPGAPAPGAASAAVKAAPDDDDGDDDSSDDEDLALVRSIRENLRLNKASPASPLPERPICAWPPYDTDDDDGAEDDLETLRAIQRRFSHYHSGTSTGSPKYTKPETSQGEIFANAPDEDFEVQKHNAKGSSRSGFPKAALLLVDALKKNRACQKFIRRKMINIETKLEENKDLRDRVKCLMGYQLSCRKSVGKILCQKEDPRVRLISSQKPSPQAAKHKYKMPALFLGPAENPHVSKYKMVLKQFPMSLQKQSWSDAEKEKLARGIKQQYQETLILDSMNNASGIGDFNAVDMALALTNGAGNFEVTPESLRSVLPLINWDKISAMYLPGRSGAECESRWLNCDDPLINHKAWTAQEETRLLLIIQEKGMCNWINIAATLGTHRTPFQCLTRYQRSLNPHILNKSWTKEEDLQLQAAVETFGCNWQLVSASLDGRTGSQCSNRWRKTLHPKRTRVGRWLLDEDKRLMVSVKLIGPGNWSRISQFIPGRTQSQCSERWHNVLDPDIDLGEWRPEEDSRLLASVSDVGPCWSKIAGVIIPHRTDNMCLRRWRQLCQDKMPTVKTAIRIKKAILQSNFVDREKERPAIGPGDLIPFVHSKGDECAENPVRRRSEKQIEDNVDVPDGLNDTPSSHNRSRKKPGTKSKAVAWKRMRGSISMDDEAIPKELRGSTSEDNEVVTDGMGDPNSVGNKEEVAKRKTRSKNSAGSEGVVKKKTRVSKSVGNDEVVKKRTRGSIPNCDGGVVNKRTRKRSSISVGDEGIVKKRMRSSASTGNHGGVTKRKRASSRISTEDNLTPDSMVRAASEVEPPSVPSEERAVDTENVSRGRRKSTPRPRQINLSEGAADKNSTCTRLAICMSFARINGTNGKNR
ncbi:hypothetical protein ACP4OV_011820 [Aristida adscensionis]